MIAEAGPCDAEPAKSETKQAVSFHKDASSSRKKENSCTRDVALREGGARLRTKLERLAARPHLVFDRAPQHDVDKMLHVLVLRYHAGRDRIVLRARTLTTARRRSTAWDASVRTAQPVLHASLRAQQGSGSGPQAFRPSSYASDSGSSVVRDSHSTQTSQRAAGTDSNILGRFAHVRFFARRRLRVCIMHAR